MKQGNIFGDKIFYGKLWKLTVPIAVQSLMLASVAAADAIMLGRVEQNAMAAVSLATQIQFIQNMVLGAIVAGLVILGAQYWGKGDKKTINDLFLHEHPSCRRDKHPVFYRMYLLSTLADADLYQ